MGLLQRVAALLGVSAYTAPPAGALPSLGSPQIIKARKALGGQLTPLPRTKTRWLLSDIEAAEHAADGGELFNAAELMVAARKDGTYAGVLSTRTGGLVRLPKRFRGRQDIVEALEVGNDSTRSVFDEMFPPTELALLAKDGFELGVFVAELVPVEGRDYPVMVRLDPRWLIYRWAENRWYYRSVVGLLPITPGDGRWILGTPGGRMAPWQNSAWRAVARAYVDKEHARLHKQNWEGKLANPARVAVSPQGAGEEQKQSWFQKVMAWGVNTVFGVTPGYDVKLLESNGRGWDAFDKTMDRCDRELTIAVAGQVVTTDGGAGFQNSDIHKTIRADLIKDTADGLAYVINTQGIPPWVVTRFGEEALDESAVFEWDVTPPKDRNSEATSLVSASSALKGLNEALAPYGRQVDIDEFATRFGLRLKEGAIKEAPSQPANGGSPALREAA